MGDAPTRPGFYWIKLPEMGYPNWTVAELRSGDGSGPEWHLIGALFSVDADDLPGDGVGSRVEPPND
jgi:hypothetical protein